LYQYNFQVLNIPIERPAVSSDVLATFYTNVNLPWVLMSTDVDLSDICIFRI
jgi:hypothetical protein